MEDNRRNAIAEKHKKARKDAESSNVAVETVLCRSVEALEEHLTVFVECERYVLLFIVVLLILFFCMLTPFSSLCSLSLSLLFVLLHTNQRNGEAPLHAGAG